MHIMGRPIHFQLRQLENTHVSNPRQAFISTMKVSDRGHPHEVLVHCCTTYQLVSVTTYQLISVTTSSHIWLVKKSENLMCDKVDVTSGLELDCI